MKQSDKPTSYVLIKAYSNSEWDNCDFAVIHINKDWKKEQANRMQSVKPLGTDIFFREVSYYDTAVDFYKTDEDDRPDFIQWFNDKPMVFVETDKEELENLSVPENKLDCYRLVIYSSGTAMYKAYGKHTGEEFWTEEFSLAELIK
jgi:hypothetical protein